MSENAYEKAIETFRSHSGLLRTQKAIDEGIAPRTLYQMRETGAIVRESRGLYRLADTEPGEFFDLVQVALRIPKGVICLISALSFHGLTTQIPHQVYVALPINAEKPRLEYPPLRLFWLSPKTYSAGIEIHEMDGVEVKIYGIEKTIADCFKFRNKVGLDVALDALRDYRERKTIMAEDLLLYARINRVERIMKPYLDVII
ncbi:MAG: type IV toxin-antitoxin system AbiEi family antitoxin domain-containing protein [Anaerolineales bacterium]|nr:type IV toxin-antitoxin system AbiEi family antitoxin domain-containing protein [Anaerolineales bacterium]